MADPLPYGQPAIGLRRFELAGWEELMHYLYLPVQMPATVVLLPERLEFLRPLVDLAVADARHSGDFYVYLTARRGFATPDNPLNRPGWHCDGFGTDDRNYIWWDRWSTRFAEQHFSGISEDHEVSLRQFEDQVDDRRVRTLPDRWLYRLTPQVVHATPIVEAPGMRSFVKVSVSYHRYNLVGNSHNYLFDYDWPMWQRGAARNDPARAQADFYDDDVASNF